MNLILMKTESDRLNAWWVPHATSTPLKRIPGQLEVESKVRTQTDFINVLGKLQNSVNTCDIYQDQSAKTKPLVPKRSRKSRVSNYFDSSSSSEDDSSETKRPIIKLSSKKCSEELLKNIEPGDGETNTVYISTKNPYKNLGIKNTAKSRKKNLSAVENPKNKNDQVETKKNETDTKSDVNNKNMCMDSDEENKILNKCKKNKLLTKNNKPSSNSTVKSINPAKGDENFELPSNFDEQERRKLERTSKAKQVLLKSIPIEKNTNQDSQDLRNCKGINTKRNKVTKHQTIRSNKIAEPLKKRTKNATSKNVTAATLKQLVNTVNPNVSTTKSNLSHQLFSESTEQEYINTLDLTLFEENENVESKRCSLQKGNNSPFIWPYLSSHKICSESKDKEGRPKREKQTQKKNCMSKAQSHQFLQIPSRDTEGECLETSFKDASPNQNVQLLIDKERLKKKSTGKNSKPKGCFLRSQEGEAEREKETVNVRENETIADDPKKKNFKNKRTISNDALNCSGTSVEINIGVPTDEMCVGDTFKCVQEKNIVHTSEKSVFKKLDELSFNGNGSGCSVVQCWNLNNFKSGVFKLKMKSHLTCRTLHSKSHLGGILVKGKLRMKIGTKEQDLKEGDMACIPPLTEWTATNIGECESVFYYWCGRFDS